MFDSAASMRRKPRKWRVAPMDRGTLANASALHIALSNAYFASLGIP
jgi:hypothetical protein